MGVNGYLNSVKQTLSHCPFRWSFAWQWCLTEIHRSFDSNWQTKIVFSSYGAGQCLAWQRIGHRYCKSSYIGIQFVICYLFVVFTLVLPIEFSSWNIHWRPTLWMNKLQLTHKLRWQHRLASELSVKAEEEEQTKKMDDICIQLHSNPWDWRNKPTKKPLPIPMGIIWRKNEMKSSWELGCRNELSAISGVGIASRSHRSLDQ